MRMTRREFLKTGGATLAVSPFTDSLFAEAEQREKSIRFSRPNIVLVLADDLGYGDLGCYGGKAETIHLNRMAREGLRFSDFHSNGAMCSPTRAALLTGRYQQRTGIEKALGEGALGLGSPHARNEITVANYLRRAGYFTGIMGKWHLGYGPEQNPIHFGFDQFRGMLHGAVDYHSHVNSFGRFDWWHDDRLVKEDGYVTDLITDHSLRFIESHQSEPFFLFVSHLAIHFPWQAPGDQGHREEGKRYREVSGPLNKLGPHPPEKTGEVVRRMILEMDKSVGRILSKLKELGLEQRTLVLFTSDNGGITEYRGGYNEISSNAPLRGGKGSVLEGGHRVPAIARWPGHIQPGTVTGETVLTMDLLPTLLELADLPAPEQDGPNKFDGVSLSPLLLRGEALRPRTVFWSAGSGLAARSGDWKLVATGEEGPQLYNLKENISESHNLAKQHPERVHNLKAQLGRWKIDVYA